MPKANGFIDFIKSLKFRFIILLSLIAIIPGTVVCTGVLNSYADRAVALRQAEVLSQAKILANQIAQSEYLDTYGEGEEALLAQISMLTNIYEGRVMVVNGDFTVITDTYNLNLGQTIISEEVIRSFSGSDVVNYESEYRYIEMAIPIIDPTDLTATTQGVLVVSVSTENINTNKKYLTRIATVSATAVIAICIVLGIFMVIFMMKPLNQLCREVARMDAGHRTRALDVFDYTETQKISENINSLVSRMKAMDESRQEFVSNVSHELKTPMTSIKVLADTINSMPDAPLEMYQEFMGDITNEIDRENKIISDLLSMVKMDRTGAVMNVTTVKINVLLEQILKRLHPIADQQKVELVLESFRPVTAEVDEVKLTLAITNLIENAIKYNRTDGTGWVHVSLNADHQYFYLKVEDNGIGMPEESLAHIFERFYRVDKSHSREIGGTGLGLAITQEAIRIHNGEVKVHSILGDGTTFDVRVPLSYIAS